MSQRSLRILPAFVLLALAAVIGCSSGTAPGNSTGPVVSVTVNGPAATRVSTTAQFTATVINNSNPAVTWQVNGVTGGSSTNGTITTSGLYTADGEQRSHHRHQRSRSVGLWLSR
jgi:hypothetical protein